jgi:hypothetical protein
MKAVDSENTSIPAREQITHDLEGDFCEAFRPDANCDVSCATQIGPLSAPQPKGDDISHIYQWLYAPSKASLNQWSKQSSSAS